MQYQFRNDIMDSMMDQQKKINKNDNDVDEDTLGKWINKYLGNFEEN